MLSKGLAPVVSSRIPEQSYVPVSVEAAVAARSKPVIRAYFVKEEHARGIPCCLLPQGPSAEELLFSPFSPLT
jgi:hypothetical protein